MNQRLVVSLVSLLLAAAATAATPTKMPSKVAPPTVKWSPVCAAFTPDDLEWYLLGCWIDPPPKDPRA